MEKNSAMWPALVLCLMYTVVCFGNFPKLSKEAQVSVITCGKGENLYSAFGHSAFRISDPKLGLDVVYNYGTFDFDQPNFYWNFTQGKLMYSLSRNRFVNFLYPYKLEQRWVKEQVLNLSDEQKNQLFQFLEDNYKPENRTYLYDPLFNNCSSIVGDILKNTIGDQLSFPNQTEQAKTYRDLVHEFLSTNSWSAFGIDLAFGGITDREAPYEDYQFLPYYTYHQLQGAVLRDQSLVSRNATIIAYEETENKTTFLASPLFWLATLLVVVLVISFLNLKYKSRSLWLDVTLFGITGVMGLVTLLLWLATDHLVTHYNLNFFWLLPTNLLFAFYLIKSEKKWISNYAKIGLIGLGIGIILWIGGIQVLNPLFLFLITMLAVRFVLHAFIFDLYGR